MTTESSTHDTDSALPEIAGYKLSRVLGHGGMSTIYLGEQVSLAREVAIKVMLPEALADEVSRRRFENEARTIARLEHPHIVGIHEVGRTRDGLPYYAMPFLARGHLGQRDFTVDGPQGYVRVRRVLQALLAALEYAHARGVVHRDVKAENVLFDEAERPLLADFGIALHKGFGPRVTTAGLAVGSTAYMAPEQARGEDVDSRADLYSVGVLAWEMLTGKLPYMAGDALSMAVMHAQDPIPRLPRPLRHWQRFVDKALAKSPAQRFRNAQQMRDALERVPHRGGQPLLLRAAERMHHGIAAIRRLPKGAWVAVLLVLAAGIGIGLRQMDGAQPDDFFRALHAETDGLPTPTAQPGQAIVGDATESLLRPLPESAAERLVSAAEQQLRQRNLSAPPGNNAYDSLLAAWQSDPAHARLPAAIGGLLDAFGEETERLLHAGDDGRARDYLDRANHLATQTHQDNSAAMTRLHARIGKALTARVDRAIASYDRAAAIRTVDSAKTLGLDAATVAMLGKRARAVPQAGDAIPGDPGMRLVRAGGKLIVAARNEVSHADYARFASATGRAAALCRERASLLRIVAPRSWQSPGFAQSPQQPVVCVSWSDAEAYARWFGQRNSHRYRLPSAAEARALPAAGGAKPVAVWSSDCSAGCRKRLADGRSWRGPSGARPLEATRGYDDVGFRLVRDP
ncbi:MAG TPA: bifunctional serine/threonine-protein kinase/formylglycine-generating enzyme family protein [Luteimonas sp.]|nr:bifunctional serine/threonine-protein kinase/formylglycine-generating enzyme family protein [Luteimonas sp.]